MGCPSRRFSLAREAIDLVLRRVKALPESPEGKALRLKAGECLREVNSWNISPPTDEQRERLMKRALKLHLDIADLERARERDPGSAAQELGRVQLLRLYQPRPQKVVRELADGPVDAAHNHEAEPESGVKTKTVHEPAGEGAALGALGRTTAKDGR